MGKSTFAQNRRARTRRALHENLKRVNNNHASCDSGGGFVVRFLSVSGGTARGRRRVHGRTLKRHYGRSRRNPMARPLFSRCCSTSNAVHGIRTGRPRLISIQRTAAGRPGIETRKRPAGRDFRKKKKFQKFERLRFSIRARNAFVEPAE